MPLPRSLSLEHALVCAGTGPLKKESSRGLIPCLKTRLFFLFNDVLLWTSTHYNFRGRIQLFGSAYVRFLLGRGSYIRWCGVAGSLSLASAAIKTKDASACFHQAAAPPCLFG